MPRPICFMVMPYGTKDSQATADKVPAKIDFDALWLKAFEPVLIELGYEPVRADQDLGASILHEMIERLYFSDLVLADMTIPNGNVYYELGVRHTCKQTGCVLIAADWSKPLFDVAQMRRLTYSMTEESLGEATAAKIREKLKVGIPALLAGESPVYQVLPGFPNQVDASRASSMRKTLTQLSDFQAKVRAVRRVPKEQQATMALRLKDNHPASPIIPRSVAMEIIYLLRDCVGWPDMLAYVDACPTSIRDLPIVREQRSLAVSKSGNHLDAIGALEELIQLQGDSSERQGLLGGRYKKLMKDATNDSERACYLDRAIQHYEQGMKLDLNDYYPTCNLPGLYRMRGQEGDEELAKTAATVTRLACERTEARGTADEWLKPTLLGAAFGAGDLAVSTRLVTEIERSGNLAAWKLETTIADLDREVERITDADRRVAFKRLLERLKARI